MIGTKISALFCCEKANDYKEDLETQWLGSKGFGNFEVNLCNRCEINFPYFYRKCNELLLGVAGGLLKSISYNIDSINSSETDGIAPKSQT